MLTIGCHMSVAKGFEKMGLTAVKIGANSFSFYAESQRKQGEGIRSKGYRRLRLLMNEHHFGKISWPTLLIP